MFQRKLGNLPRKPPVFKPPSFKPAEDEDSKHKDKAWIDDTTEEQLQDDPDLDDDRFLQEYRECGLLLQCLEQLATKYPATKFVKIISTDCIPNYPDCNLPTLLVYNNGAAKANYIGFHNFGRRCTHKAAPKRHFQSDSLSADPNYKSLYIDSQKKIVALKNENSELSKKLDVALGKIEV
ncbi:unnamed protein product [Camellia sinensis]